ncbi:MULTISPECIES: helix-turn-helix transcriptional regulator [unclassified Burkholderia]|uniref:helix-turn-helix domain-containing protein n=1 Tax=unclassified Burkholderia TaxID=2613784 RepID=UPI001FC8E671|nr:MULTISPECIES: helix-turn-helix transcriptional regulator [unclassified Burkholderia]
MNRAYVSGIERGSINIRLDNIGKLASALEVHAARFLGVVDGDKVSPVTCVDLRSEVTRHVREFRKFAGISQERLAEVAGFHRTYVGNVERGIANLSLDDLEALASVLKVDPAQLLDDESAVPDAGNGIDP